MKEKEPTKLTVKNQGASTANVGAGLVPAQYAKQRGITPVSYTHLDVYKRQDLLFRIKSLKSS